MKYVHSSDRAVPKNITQQQAALANRALATQTRHPVVYMVCWCSPATGGPA